MQSLIALLLAASLADAGRRQKPLPDLPTDVFAPAPRAWGLIDPPPPAPIKGWIKERDRRSPFWPDLEPVILIAAR
jgi:hypothetical protein